jgi:hypothetical protein
VGYEINWTANAGDEVLDHPYYQQFSYAAIATIDENDIKAAIGSALASRDSSAIVSYLCWLLRVKQLLA